MPLRLFGQETKDSNGNQYPQIYTKALDPSSDEPLYRQVNRFFAPRIERRLGMVHSSAYLEKCLFDPSRYYQQIMKRLEKCARIRGASDDYDIVFLWNIGDITMLTKNHIDELDMLIPEINSKSLYNLQKNICNSVNFNCFELTELIKIVGGVENIEDAFSGETDEMRKAAPMYNALRELYNGVQQNGSKEKGEIISHDLLEKLGIIDQQVELCRVAKEHQKVYNQRWKCAKKCLKLVNKRSAQSKTKNYANIVISEQGVPCGVAQLLIAGCSSIVPIENIYSIYPNPPQKPNAWYAMKSVHERIRKRFGEKCCLVYVSSGPTYSNIPMEGWSIQARESIKYLFNFQKDVLN